MQIQIKNSECNSLAAQMDRFNREVHQTRIEGSRIKNKLTGIEGEI